jgi:hypothetical protein
VLPWQAIEKSSHRWRSLSDERCVPQGAQTGEHFDAEELNPLVT